MNGKKGAISGGMLLLIAVALVFAYTQNFVGLKDLISPAPTPPTPGPTGTVGCPSSGLTSVTINAQEALASTATDANVSYYVYDGSSLIANGDTGSDGAVSIDVACGAGKSYKGLVINEKRHDGFYPQQFTVDATGPTDVHNFKMYQFGTIDVASIVASSDPTGGTNISGAAGRSCGWTVTFSENETASAYDNPIVLCRVNSTAVIDLTLSGTTLGSRPSRINTLSGFQDYAFVLGQMVKSTDSAVKLSGKLVFSSSASFADTHQNNLSCIVIDQATYRVAEFKTLSLEDGFKTAAENEETVADIGGADSDRATLMYGGTYC